MIQCFVCEDWFHSKVSTFMKQSSFIHVVVKIHVVQLDNFLKFYSTVDLVCSALQYRQFTVMVNTCELTQIIFIHSYTLFLYFLSPHWDQTSLFRSSHPTFHTNVFTCYKLKSVIKSRVKTNNSVKSFKYSSIIFLKRFNF